jgi:hypothetical protein
VDDNLLIFFSFFLVAPSFKDMDWTELIDVGTISSSQYGKSPSPAPGKINSTIISPSSTSSELLSDLPADRNRDVSCCTRCSPSFLRSLEVLAKPPNFEKSYQRFKTVPESSGYSRVASRAHQSEIVQTFCMHPTSFRMSWAVYSVAYLPSTTLDTKLGYHANSWR